MRRITFLIFVGLLGTAVLFGGCGDDETITNTVYVTDTLTITDTLLGTQLPHISGYVFVDPFLYMYADIYSSGPLEPTIDSVIVADSQAIVGLWTSISVIEPAGFAVYDNVDDTRLVAGDTAEMRIYSGTSQSSASVKLLNFTEDSTVIIAPADGDSSNAGAAFTIIWESVPHADWYGLSLQYVWDIDLLRYTQMFIGSTPDTQFVIDGSMTLYNGSYDISVVPVSGPDPESTEGNMTGNAVIGTVYSLAGAAARQTIIGDGLSEAPLATGGSNMKSVDQIRELIETLNGEISNPQVRRLR